MKIVSCEVTLKRVDGTDIDVANSARVSFNKESEWEVGPSLEAKLSDKDAKLIHYLARNNHWSPLAHVGAQFRIKAPIFVARQLVKHQTGAVWNEVSRRYVSDEPEYFKPKWRWAAANVKQGSGSEMDEDASAAVDATFWPAVEHCHAAYLKMLDMNVAPEQARSVLNLNHMTEWIWTGSLVFWARVCKLRLDSHAQGETSDIARPISDALLPVFPVSWAALMEN